MTQAAVNGNLTDNDTYDAVGNRLTDMFGGTYSYNNSNQLTSYPVYGYSWTYDSNGNDTSEAASGAGTTGYNWDFENRMSSVTLPNGGGTVNFKYDPFGRRIEKSSSAGTTIYAYDGDNIIEELNTSGSPTARYTQGLGIDEPLEVYEGGKSYYYHADGLGSVVALTKSTGTAANTYFGYNTFGGMPAPTETVANPFRFTGREWDSETSLYYYRARYYDPLFGRFLSEDPIGINGGVNAYRFVVNDPATLRDPRGLWPETLRAIASDASDLTDWLRGTGGAGINHVEDAAAHELADTPGMQDIRRQYKETNCEFRGYLCNNYQYSEFLTTENLTGQLVGSFCVKFVPISKGRVLVEAQNSWGLESATRVPEIGSEDNRNNPSIQQMILDGAPLTYPKSVLENRSSGPMRNLTVHYFWTERSPCCGH